MSSSRLRISLLLAHQMLIPSCDINFLYRSFLMITQMVEVAAAGYSLLYLLLGGGFGGAILIFIVAKMLGR
jgi:hypothetical protein